ncbi:hypothetical protein GCM10027181_32850 [Rheinheimera gaetbuli]
MLNLKLKSKLMLFLESIAVMFLLTAVSLVLLHAHPTSFKLISPLAMALAGTDNVLHVFVGAVLPFSLAIICRVAQRSARFNLIFFMVFPVCYALDEFIQSFTPHRKSDWADFGMSLAGWLMAISVWCLLHVCKTRLSRR